MNKELEDLVDKLTEYVTGRDESQDYDEWCETEGLNREDFASHRNQNHIYAVAIRIRETLIAGGLK